MATALVVGTFSAVFGLFVGHHHDTAPGATMALSAVVVSLLLLIATLVRQVLFGNHTGLLNPTETVLSC